MDKDLGYQELLTLARRLEERAGAFAVDADESQAEGMTSYLTAQANSLEQARFTYENDHNEFLEVAKSCIAAADKNATLRLLSAYGKYGIKEN